MTAPEVDPSDFAPAPEEDLPTEILRGSAARFFEPLQQFDWRALGINLGVAALAGLFGFLLWIIIRVIVPAVVRRKNGELAQSIVKHTSTPFAVLLPFLA